MAERDGYIPGVPCWVDTSQPDPEAAAAFYRGLFGWELEDTMPVGSPGSYFMARRGSDAAAISSPPQGAEGYAVPDSFNSTTSAQRTRWFKLGFETGDLARRHLRHVLGRALSRTGR